jgi:hypothetical protein
VDHPIVSVGAGVWRTFGLVPVIDIRDIGPVAARDYSESSQFTFAANEEMPRHAQLGL